tara:strand:- start:153 stop:395 length:243 start_codon:yes stop_codon:yes gene_type:complete
MDSHHIFLLGIFAVVSYFILTDENVAAAFYYVIQLAKTNIRKRWWWLTNNPKNPIVRYLIWRRSMKMAKQIRSAINNENR